MPSKTTLQETLRSPVDGSEFIRLATPGANWKAPLSAILPMLASANVDYYVSTTGSDSNDGKTPSSPFATLQHALNVINTIDWFGQFVPTIHMANGTYNGANQGFGSSNFSGLPLNFAALPGNAGAAITIVGNAVTPANVVIDFTTQIWQFYLLINAFLRIGGVHFKTDGGVCFGVGANAKFNVGAVAFETAIGNVELESVSGSSGFETMLFGTGPALNAGIRTVDGCICNFAQTDSLTISGTANVGDWSSIIGLQGGGCAFQAGGGLVITTDITAGSWWLLKDFAFGQFVFSIFSGSGHVMGPWADLIQNSSFLSNLAPDATPGTSSSIVDGSSTWAVGQSGTFYHVTIPFPVPAGITAQFHQSWAAFKLSAQTAGYGNHVKIDDAGTFVYIGDVGLYTKATLPAGYPANTRAWISDGNAETFGTGLTGGGAVLTPVYFDGTIWRAG